MWRRGGEETKWQLIYSSKSLSIATWNAIFVASSATLSFVFYITHDVIVFYLETAFCRKTLRHPTRNLEILNERFEVIEFCLNPDNHSVVENLTSCLKRVYRLTNVILDRYLAQQVKISDWRRLHKVYHAFQF